LTAHPYSVKQGQHLRLSGSQQVKLVAAERAMAAADRLYLELTGSGGRGSLFSATFTRRTYFYSLCLTTKEVVQLFSVSTVDPFFFLGGVVFFLGGRLPSFQKAFCPTFASKRA